MYGGLHIQKTLKMFVFNNHKTLKILIRNLHLYKNNLTLLNNFLVDSYDRNSNLVVRNQIVTFAVGAGKFGGPRTGTKTVSCLPKPSRKPDLSLTQSTSVDQAALYRLTGK